MSMATIESLTDENEDTMEADPEAHHVDETTSEDHTVSPVIDALSFEDLRRLLIDKHDTSISNDDPFAIYLTVFNAALMRADEASVAQVNKLTALTDEAVQRLTSEVHDAVGPIAETVLKAQFTTMLEEARLYALESTKIQASMKRLAWGLGIVSVIVSLAAVGSMILFFVK